MTPEQRNAFWEHCRATVEVVKTWPADIQNILGGPVLDEETTAMKEPTFDKDGYPTDETLQAITQWSLTDVRGCFDFIEQAWEYPENIRRNLTPEEITVTKHLGDGEVRVFATGGWSGNESLIYALMQNLPIYGYSWMLSVRGGLHIFRLKDVQKEEKS